MMFSYCTFTLIRWEGKKNVTIQKHHAHARKATDVDRVATTTNYYGTTTTTNYCCHFLLPTETRDSHFHLPLESCSCPNRGLMILLRNLRKAHERKPSSPWIQLKKGSAAAWWPACSRTTTTRTSTDNTRRGDSGAAFPTPCRGGCFFWGSTQYKARILRRCW